MSPKEKEERKPCQGSHCNGKNAEMEPHPCPFAADVYDDKEYLCTCCEECTYECAQDI